MSDYPEDRARVTDDLLRHHGIELTEVDYINMNDALRSSDCLYRRTRYEIRRLIMEMPGGGAVVDLAWCPTRCRAIAVMPKGSILRGWDGKG